MASLQYYLEKAEAKRKAGKSVHFACTSGACLIYIFRSVIWGGTSPQVGLEDSSGVYRMRSAAEWKRSGVIFR